jgi:hypothetical protein
MNNKQLIRERYATVSGIFPLVVVCGSTALYYHQGLPKMGNDLDCIIPDEQILEVCSRIIKSVGGKIIHDFTTDRGKFDLRRSFRLPNGYKVEFFIDPVEGKRNPFTGLEFCSQANIWAAREYYSKKLGSSKYQDQIIWAKVQQVAAMSPEKWQVGAVYVNDDLQVSGYNHHRSYCGHAEITAIRRYEKKTFRKARGGRMYCTLSPCTNCAKELEARNIEAVYQQVYTGKL